jgi:hypothetical protein
VLSDVSELILSVPVSFNARLPFRAYPIQIQHTTASNDSETPGESHPTISLLATVFPQLKHGLDHENTVLNTAFSVPLWSPSLSHCLCVTGSKAIFFFIVYCFWDPGGHNSGGPSVAAI